MRHLGLKSKFDLKETSGFILIILRHKKQRWKFQKLPIMKRIPWLLRMDVIRDVFRKSNGDLAFEYLFPIASNQSNLSIVLLGHLKSPPNPHKDGALLWYGEPLNFYCYGISVRPVLFFPSWWARCFIIRIVEADSTVSLQQDWWQRGSKPPKLNWKKLGMAKA